MKGQYSLDFLVTMAGAVAFFLVIATASLDLGREVTSGLSTRDSLLAGKQLVDNIQSICLMGEGSKAELKLWFPTETKIASSSGKISVAVGNTSKAYYVSCKPVFYFHSLKGAYQFTILKIGDSVQVNARKL